MGSYRWPHNHYTCKCRLSVHKETNYLKYIPPFNAAEEDFHIIIKILELDDNILAVNLTIINDVFVESNETFVIYLTSGAGVKLFPHAQTEVIIIDDEGKC